MILETDIGREGKLNLFSLLFHSGFHEHLALLCTAFIGIGLTLCMNTHPKTPYFVRTARWHTSTVSLSYDQKRWLTLHGSLTRALRSTGDFTLRVLYEGRERAWQDEAQALGLKQGAEVWVREVIMALDGIPCVAARSLTPITASKGDWRGLRHCGSTPLGSQLYHRADIRRTPFQWCAWHHAALRQHKTSWQERLARWLEGAEYYSRSTTTYQPTTYQPITNQPTAEKKIPSLDTPLLVRRSIFTKKRHVIRKKQTTHTGTPGNCVPMIVMECFLPAFWQFAKGYQPINLKPRWSPCRSHA